ncbi:major facilitator superfamily domain-containing protein [Yarrowia lipolytica]|nr:major facilitator superfamily domain-containing protein [Yarrowia lipolytica]KAE8174031.1 major facilitator superfamily domain-containing protein [Yarrowia lipolytica]KAJ8051669.1 major facilitator superfamily domain-containing protein [Yarrowia lipolytica]
MMLVYAIQYLDKSTKSTAGSSRRPEDGRRRLCAFYIGYLIFEFLSVYILQHFPLVKTVSVFIILWGLVLCLQAASNYPGFIALRAILGMLESAVTLCFVILTSPWCKREEQFLRTSIWLGANELGLMVGSFMAYGQAANPPLTIAGWRLIFIITGVFTVVVSIIVLRNKKLKREQSIEALTDTRT